MIDLNSLEKKIDYLFKDETLATMAFSHSSYSNENKNTKLLSYERLEFLGDAIVDMIVSEYLYSNYPNLSEGELTKIRAIVVCEPTFSSCSKSLGLGKFLLLGKGEEITGGRERVSILADIFESISGAIYLDGGYKSVKKFVLKILKPIIINAINGTVFMDYKTQLQEILQKNRKANIVYEITNQTGPDHNKRFEINVSNMGQVLGKGIGKSKKEAEQMAAKHALEKNNLKEV